MSIMTQDLSEASVWGIKYRPQTIQECILPVDLKTQFQKIVDTGKIPNLLLHSTQPGSGKTTSILCLCKQLGYDVLFINASLDNSIDDIRNKIVGFCSSVSLDDKPKVVFWDEADSLSLASQKGCRGLLEQYSNITFIMTCNYVGKLIEPIRSRFSTIEFKIPEDERKDLLKQFTIRVFEILDKEEVEYDKKAVLQFVSKYHPDYRKTLNELQRYSLSGCIDAGILSTIADVKVETLFTAMKERNFANARKWIGENAGVDWETFYGQLYELMYDRIEPSSIPPAILVLAKYQFQSATVADQQLNFAAAVVELMGEVQFR